ncbi:MAG: transporter substrate-binding domain-containing protein [Desulfobacterales bacterium]|nr:transporter substrate-binding domain-containing protein [Desulfobacterales bacterium]
MRMCRMVRKVFYTLILVLVLSGGTYGQDRPLLVGISYYKPFVFGEQGGPGQGSDQKFEQDSVQGFAIDLWEKIARDNQWKFEYVYSDFKTKLDNVRSKKVDLAIGGITITAEREEDMNFSSPTFNAGLGILIKKTVENQSILPIIAGKLFTWEIAGLFLMLFGCLLFWGFWLWMAEKGSNLIRHSFKDGYPDAVWCAWMIKTTIGFGDVYPKRFLGRLTTLPIFITGVIALSLIMAPINAAFLVRDIEVLESRISGPIHLSKKTVATKADTYAVEVLQKYDAIIIEVPTIAEAYALLMNEEVEAVVYDLPGLMHHEKDNRNVALVGKGFAGNHYGFAFPEDSHLQEAINRTLLKLKEDGVYKEIYEKWF